MPGLPLPNHDTVNNGCASSYPRSAGQMCGQQSRAQLSPDEELTLEECLALYRRPVELYNIIQLRAIKNPPSLQRCLSYKTDAKQKRRIQISVSISGSTNTELPAHGIFPLHVLFARATSNDPLDGRSPVYRFSRACLLTSFSESGDSDHSKAIFTIPDLKSLATLEVSNHNIILISCGQRGEHLSGNFSENHMEYSSPQKLGGQCSWGKIPIDLLCSALDNCITLSLGRTLELTPQISMSPGFIEPAFLENGSCLTFRSRKAYATGSYELRASIYAQVTGAKDMHLSPYSCYSYDDIPLSSLPHIIRLRTGNVLFNYKHCKKFLKSEVTEDFSCSFCLVKCGSFKGLEYHLTSSHELFHFEFWVSEDYQAVNVSLKIDTRRAELLTTAGDDLSKREFFYRSRFKKRCRILETTIEKTKHVHPHIMGHVHAHKESALDYVPNENGISALQASISHPALHGNNHLTPAVLQFGKTRKLSVDQADPKNRLLLENKFFHSQKAQRMEPEEVLADHDSEDEIDNDITDFEDMTRLDGFSNVTKDEKRIMHMWNSFIRRQRVLVDGHIRWACDAFSRQHGQELVHNPPLRWCWRLFMTKLWKHNLLDARTMNACNKFLDDLESKAPTPSKHDSEKTPANLSRAGPRAHG